MTAKRQLPFASASAKVSYNGYNFYETIRSRIVAFPEYAEGGTHVKYVRYQITIHAIVAAGDGVGSSGSTNVAPSDSGSTDENLEDLRKRLTAPRKTLQFSDVGYGDFSINFQGIQDVKYGPKPRMLSWEPIGNDQAARVVWTVDTWIPECQDGTPLYQNGVASHTVMTTHGFTEGTRETISVNGTIEVAGNATDGSVGSSGNTAIDFINSWDNFPVTGERGSENGPEGYQLVDRRYSVSEDRRTITYNFSWEEIDTPNRALPEGVWNIQATHSMSTKSGKTAGAATPIFNNALRVRIKLESGFHNDAASRQKAFAAFLKISDSRLGHILRSNGDPNLQPIVRSLRMEEDIMGREFSFEVQWTAVISRLDFLFQRTNFFQPANFDAQTHRQSQTHRDKPFVTDQTAKPYKIRHLCNNGTNSTLKFNPRIQQLGTTRDVFDLQCPPASQSWIAYRNNVQVLGNTNVAVNDIARVVEASGSGNSPSGDEDVGYIDGQHRVVNDQTTVVQIMGASFFRVRMVGYSLRYGSPSAIPSLEQVGNRPVVLISEKIQPGVIVEDGPCPIYLTKWDKYYAVERGIPRNQDLNQTEGTPTDDRSNPNLQN